MFNGSKDDDQVFMVFVGGRSCAEDKNEFGNVLVGVLATAIAMMVFVALVRDAEQRRGQAPTALPIPRQQTIRPANYPDYPTY
jgi:hypothetical protein